MFRPVISCVWLFLSLQVRCDNNRNTQPKHWFSYVSRFLEKATKRSGKESLTLMIEHGRRFAVLMTRHQGKVLNFADVPGFVFQNTGNLVSIVNTDGFPCNIAKEYPPSCYVYSSTVKFQLDRRLSLNLTVHDLLFASGPKDCLAGNFTISKINEEPAILRLCGHYSNLKVFPGFSDVEAKITFFNSIHHWFQSSFSIVDKGFVSSFQTYDQALVYPIQQLVLHDIKLLLLDYFITVDKVKYISVFETTSTAINIQVHDGPGVLAPAIEGVQGSYVCTTFQCLVIVRATSSDRHINFLASIFTETTKVSISSETVLNLPGDHCARTPCVIQLRTNHSSQINVTNLATNYKGKKLNFKGFDVGSLLCTFAGLIAAEHLRGIYQESYTVCTEHNHSDSGLSRSFYSSEASLILVLYWYKSYAEIDVILNVSNTPCKAIEINLCMCVHNFQTNKVILDAFNQMNEVKLTKRHGSECSFFVSFPDDNCYIFQLYKKGNRTSEHQRAYEFCSLSLLLNPELPPGTEVVYQMQGSLNNINSANVQKYPTNLPYDMWEYVYLVNLEKKDCHNVFEIYPLHCFRLQDRTLSKIIFMFKMKMTFKSPTKKNKFEMAISFYPHTISWFDFVVRKHSRETNVESLCFSMEQRYPMFSLLSPREKQASLHSGDPFQRNVLFLFSNGTLHQENIYIAVEISSVTNKAMLGVGYLPITVSWKTVFKFNQMINKQFVSLQLSLDSTTITTLPGKSTLNFTLFCMLITDNHKNYMFMTNSKSQRCESSGVEFDMWLMGKKYFCLKVFFALPVKRNFLLIGSDFLDQEQTWNDASELCASIGGHLPYFTSRNDLEEVIALFKLSPHATPVKALFIGLKMVSSLIRQK